MFMHEAKSLEHLEHNVSYQRLRKVPIPVTKVLLEKVLKVESHINKSLDIVHICMKIIIESVCLTSRILLSSFGRDSPS